MKRYMVEQIRTGGFVVYRRVPPDYETEVVGRFEDREAADAYMRERCGPPNNHYEPADEFSEGVWYLSNTADPELRGGVAGSDDPLYCRGCDHFHPPDMPCDVSYCRCKNHPPVRPQ